MKNLIINNRKIIEWNLLLVLTFLLISKFHIGNDILGYMFGPGRFDDFTNLILLSPNLPDNKSPIQYSAFSILFGRIFNDFKIFDNNLIV